MQLRLMVSGRVLTALVMLVIFLSTTAMALGFPEKARLMPLMVGVPGSLLAFFQLLIELRKAGRELPKKDQKTREKSSAEVQMFLWMFLFFIGILAFGFVYAAPFLVFGFLRFGKKETWKTALYGGIGTWIVLYGFFEWGFEIPLFEGFIFDWLFG